MLNFKELIESEECLIRGKLHTFYEIGAADWLNYCQSDDEKSEDLSLKELIKKNNAYSARVVACSLRPGTEQSIEALASELEALPAKLLTAFFDAAAKANNLPTIKELSDKENTEKKTSPASDSPESSPES